MISVKYYNSYYEEGGIRIERGRRSLIGEILGKRDVAAVVGHVRTEHLARASRELQMR